MKDNYLFVYGTLRRNVKSEMDRLLARSADFIDEATFQGRLYKIAYYPGVMPSSDPQDIVHGEVFRLHEPATALAQLDRYEECGPGFPEPTEFIRRKMDVNLRRGETITAWIYIYNRPTDKLVPIKSGDWFRFQTKNN